jgi:hypothetical protein
MANSCALGILSDVHYAGAAERARGNDFELRTIQSPLLRLAVRFHRRVVWLRRPLEQNFLLDRFLAEPDSFDYVIANGDYSCNSAFIGVSDPAALESAQECLGKLRSKFGSRLRTVFGDHELGKVNLVGSQGNMRLDSWRRATRELGLEPFWTVQIGCYVLIGIVSSLAGFPALEPDTLPEEREEWARLRADHMTQIRSAFLALQPHQRVLLFCHDPTALTYLGREEVIRARLGQIERTIIGHLHSELILRASRMLAGMPRVDFLGHTGKKLSLALRQARDWTPFKVRLCPALAGIELMKDGGYLSVQLHPDGSEPARFVVHRLHRN